LGLTTTLIEAIDLRSFSSLWYWIAQAVLWSGLSHWVLGVPYDLILRARRLRGAAEDDLRDLVRINAARRVSLADAAGPLLPAGTFFVLTVLLLLGFAYRIEFAQAVVLMLLPVSLVMALSLRAARRALAVLPDTAPLYPLLWRHRLACQVIGVAAIFVAAMWGMGRNLGLAALVGLPGH
jgi:hypothetical protein